MTGIYVASHTLFVVLYSRGAYKRGKMNMISLYIFSLNALQWLGNPHVFSFSLFFFLTEPPPPSPHPPITLSSFSPLKSLKAQAQLGSGFVR